MPSLIPVEERQPHFEETLYNTNGKKLMTSKRATEYNLNPQKKKGWEIVRAKHGFDSGVVDLQSMKSANVVGQNDDE